jgi:hypothetical protein
MPAQQALAINRIETGRILERICFYDDSFAQKWQIKGFQIADFRFWEWQNKKHPVGVGAGVFDLNSKI